ncbi:hypothetical protein PVAND_015807 [Polypedilum vanderplanki]|uniref:Uncharacterized protein n=1 Tax=Polypedilum vanderplanki TaxID=319348 RepID=A0A9J6BE77_POLVA|nr:hypothetical protein PVAND_015807 [Polypedilum vanderplanki]
MQSTLTFVILTIFSANKFIYFVNAGGTAFSPCTNHIQDVKEHTEIFLSSISDVQNKCILSLSSFAAANSKLPKTAFTNKLYEIYSDCVNEEGDKFKEYYDGILKKLTNVQEIDISESVMSYLTGVVDVTQFPFVCINDDLETAVETISLYDKQLSAASQYYLKDH